MRLPRFLAPASAAASALVLVAVMALAPALAFAAAGVTADVRARVSGSYAGAPSLGSSTYSFDENVTNPLTPGTGNNQADKMYAATRTISASSSENLDLAGTLTDPFGVTLTCVKVKFIYVHAAKANTNSVILGGATTNAFTGPFGVVTDYTAGTYSLGTVTLPPDGQFLATAPAGGWTVTASTGDLLKVANSSSGTGVTYDVVIGCTSA